MLRVDEAVAHALRRVRTSHLRALMDDTLLRNNPLGRHPLIETNHLQGQLRLGHVAGPWVPTRGTSQEMLRSQTAQQPRAFIQTGCAS